MSPRSASAGCSPRPACRRTSRTSSTTPAWRRCESDNFLRIAKNTFQPDDFSADSAGFKAHIEQDVIEKRRLLTALGMVKN